MTATRTPLTDRIVIKRTGPTEWPKGVAAVERTPVPPSRSVRMAAKFLALFPRVVSVWLGEVAARAAA